MRSRGRLSRPRRAPADPGRAEGGSRGPDEVRARREATCRAAGTTSRPTCPRRCRRCCTPARCQPIGPADLAPLFPMEIIKQEVSQERYIDIPERSAGRLPALAAHAALPRASPGEGARHPRAHLLQVRGRQPRRAATSRTPPSPRPTTTSQEGVKRLATETGAGPVGQRAGHGLPDVRPRVQGLHGASLLRPEALPPLDDGDAGARGVPARATRPTPGARILAQDPDSPGSLGIAISEAVEDAATARRHQVLARQRAEPRADAPDGHRPGGAASRWRWPATTPTWSSAASAAAATSAASPSRSSRDKLTGERKDLRVIAVEPPPARA